MKWLIFNTIILLALSISQAQLKGSLTYTLSSPITKEFLEESRKNLKTKIAQELNLWLAEKKSILIDTTNAFQASTYSVFVDSCFKLGKEESFFNGKQWTIQYTIQEEAINNALQNYNRLIDQKTIISWQRTMAALELHQDAFTFNQSIETLAFALSRLGEPLKILDSTKTIVDETRKIAQEILNRITIKPTEMIIQGKPGQFPNNNPELIAKIDSFPFPNLNFKAYLLNGKEVFTSATDLSGIISLKNQKIPFVANGTFLFISLDLGAILKIDRLIEPKHLGISMKNGHDITFIYKITRPTFALEYSAQSVSKIALPTDFATDSYMKKFLRDSCYMEFAGSTTPDLIINIQTQVSSYTYDETEETGIKTMSQISIKGLSFIPNKTEQKQFIFEKKYEKSTDIPYGLYFWETSGKLRTSIKDLLLKM